MAAGIVMPFGPIRAQQQPVAPAQQSQPSRGSEPGFLDALKRFVDDSIGSIGTGLGSAAPTDAPAGPPTEAGEALKDAATSVARLPGTGVVTGREHCKSAANGGPDCRTAADNVCRSKGYRGGRSLDVQAAERCPAQVYISGRAPAPGECRTETFVTRAVCQ
jgi:hypothetical protein